MELFAPYLTRRHNIHNLRWFSMFLVSVVLAQWAPQVPNFDPETSAVPRAVVVGGMGRARSYE